MVKFILVFLCVPLMLFSVQGDPFILFTVPKSGTFLSIKLLKLLSGAESRMIDENSKGHNLYQYTFKKGIFYFTHYRNHFDVKAFKHLYPNVKPIVSIRDPRDVCVSTVYYYIDVLNKALGPQSTFDERLSYTINYLGCNNWFGPTYYFTRALQLIDHLNPIIIRFEDLVGPHGGGNIHNQLFQIYKVANALHIPMNEEFGLYVADQLFGGTPTFRDGKIGSWREEFKPEHIEQFKASPLENFLLRFGYEENHDW